MWTENPIFREDLDRLTSYDYIPWDDLRDSTVFITGATLHVVEGPVENIKITTPSDFYVFRAISEARENSQIWGI